MITNPQRAALAIGKTGCYFLSILSIAESVVGRQLDPLVCYGIGRRDGSLGEDCMVLDAGRLLAAITSQPYQCIKAGDGHPLPLDYQCRPGEREVLRYERPAEPGDTADSERAHFVLGDGRGRMAWDPWGDSRTVKAGKLVSKRIFRRG